MVAGFNQTAFEPHACNFQMLLKLTADKGLIGMRQTQSRDIPGHESAACIHMKHRLVMRLASVVGQCFQGQPFQTGVFMQMCMYLLQRGLCVRAVKARSPGCGDQGMRTALQLDVD